MCVEKPFAYSAASSISMCVACAHHRLTRALLKKPRLLIVTGIGILDVKDFRAHLPNADEMQTSSSRAD